MTPCPSNTEGSNGLGVFYFTPKASGAIISGFTIINEEYKVGTTDPYGIYINGAENITVKDCNIEKILQGPGIYVKNSANTLITNTTVTNSVKGIYIDNSPNTIIQDNTIQSNVNAGIYVVNNSSDLTIKNNSIINNNYYGIYLSFVNNGYILNNKIENNRNNIVAERATDGVGIYVDCTVNNLQILGNLINENGLYGIYDSPKFTNMIDQYVQIIDNNYFMNHIQRAVYHANPQGETDIIYVWSNYYVNELFCGGTSYEPGILISDHSRDLIMSNITEIKNGVYSVSFIRKDNGEIAKYLNAINITFFLNKNNNYPLPQDEDIYKITDIINGTAIVSFTDKTYLPTGNNITAVGPGNGVITYQSIGQRPSQIYLIEDSHIPLNTLNPSILKGNGLTKYYGDNNSLYIIQLNDENGNPLPNQNVIIELNNRTYNKTTDSEGKASININLNPGQYNIILRYDGNDNYDSSQYLDLITIMSTINGNNIVKYYHNDTRYYANFTNIDGTPLANTNVQFNIHGVFYNTKTNENGTASLGINLLPGEYIITAYNPTANNQAFSNNITVLSTLETNDVIKYFRNETQFTAKVLNEVGDVVAGSVVTFNIHGKLYTRVTDSNGIATLNINLDPGNYTITTYNNLTGQSIGNSVKIIPILTGEDLNKNFEEEGPYVAHFVNSQGYPVAEKDITFNINGVIYHKTTNTNGDAILKINLARGKYIITAYADLNDIKTSTSNMINVL